MTSILDLLNSETGKQLISSTSKQTGQSEANIAQVLGMAFPAILGAMQQNASTPEGAQSLNLALEDQRHDGSILEQLGSLLGGNDDGESSLLSDGAGILKHVLGGKQPVVEQNISKTTGIDAASVAKIIQIAAPILMGILGSKKRKDNVDQGGLGGLLGSLLGGSSSGNILGDVAGMVLGGKKKKGGLGDLLGGILGK